MHTRQSPLSGATAGMRSRCASLRKKKNNENRQRGKWKIWGF